MDFKEAMIEHDKGNDVYRMSDPDWIFYGHTVTLCWSNKSEDEIRNFNRRDLDATDWAVVEETQKDKGIIESADSILNGNMDARIWAEEFVKRAKKDSTFATDEGNMIGWFANAIMVGYDTNKNEPVEDKVESLSDRVNYGQYEEKDIKEFIDNVKKIISEEHINNKVVSNCHQRINKLAGCRFE